MIGFGIKFAVTFISFILIKIIVLLCTNIDIEITANMYEIKIILVRE